MLPLTTVLEALADDLRIAFCHEAMSFVDDGCCRDYCTGMLWRWAGSGRAARWLPDHTDAATAGVLIKHLGDSFDVARRPMGWSVLANFPDSSGFVATDAHDTLGEAAARALVAMWGLV